MEIFPAGARWIDADDGISRLAGGVDEQGLS
jgi:hypothetical protein